MKIIDLTQEYEPLYYVCLEDWSEEMKEAGDHKQRWMKKMQEKGLRVKLALSDDGTVCGMAEYLPVEYSFADGKDLYFMNCIWVHGHKQGIGDKRRQGYGKALLKAAEEDAKALGAKGMAAHGLKMPVWIPAKFFMKQGYEPVDKDGISLLLFKPFSKDAEKPKFVRQVKTPEKQKNPGKVTITFLLNGYCPGRSIVFERAKKAAASFGDKVVFEVVDTSDLQVYREWGLHNELFIEDEKITFGPPLPAKKIEKLIAKKLKKL